MMKYKNDIIFLLLIFLSCICWCLGLCNGEKLIKNYSTISLRFEVQPLNIQKLNEIYERQKKDDKNNAELTAWTQKNRQKIKGLDNNEIIESDVIYIWGKVNDELKLYADNGCAISGDKAYELWKSSDVLGKTVDINNVTYKISAVLNDVSDIVMVNADKYNEDMTFNALEIKAVNENTSWSVDGFKAENSLDSNVTVCYAALSDAAYKIAFIPGWIIGIIMTLKIISKLYLKRKNKLIFVCMLLVLFVWIAVSSILCQFSFEFPQSFIPTRWSNFEFWGRTFDNVKVQLRKLNLMKVYYTDEYFKKTFNNIVINCMISSVCIITSFKHMKIQSINKLITLEIFVALILFVVVVITLWTGSYADYTAGYWTMIPLYMVFDYFIENFRYQKEI